MAYQSIPPQGCFFYEGKWDEDSTNAFINLLLEDQADGCWVVNGDNEASLLTALQFLNTLMEKEFLWDDILAQLKMLKKRYLTFKTMLEIEGVNWDRIFNHVYVFSPVWLQLVKANDFALAFYHKGDIMHDKLALLFGHNSDIETEIIQISSGDQEKPPPNSAKAPISIDDSDDEGSVQSPGIGTRKPPQKRLFQDSEVIKLRSPISAESNNVRFPLGLRKPTERHPLGTSKSAFPPPPIPAAASLLRPKNATTSSSASTSPFKLMYSPQEKN